MKYAFWNNKGGTGKTSLAFQSICRYAELNQSKRILVIDICPQANISELLLGSITNRGGAKLLQIQAQSPRCSIGGYFQMRLPSPYNTPQFNPSDYIITPRTYNYFIPSNIDLVCGDPLLELQANAINTLSNTQVPGTNTWLSVIDWMNDFINNLSVEYDTIFLDCNPSFSIYTQIAISCVDRLLLPVMADDSSRRAIQNAISLVYGIHLPSSIYSQYTFGAKLSAASRALPSIHIVIKNRLTQYMGSASAYSAVLSGIDSDVSGLLSTNKNIFTFRLLQNGVVDIRDFQTTGVVSFAKGCPFSKLTSGRQNIGGHRVRVNEGYRQYCLDAIDSLVSHF